MSNSSDWVRYAFLPEPAQASVDGGTTSAGNLWHAVSTRWGPAMHTMCSYYGMFPAKVAHYFIQKYTRPGDLILDPFSGRGTTALQAKSEGRRAICNDLSPLAYVMSRAKVDPPAWEHINSRIDQLEAGFRHGTPTVQAPSEIQMLYHEETLSQIQYIREQTRLRDLHNLQNDDYMILGCLAGIMHGGWRNDGTSQYLSISMPNTFSMSPAYVKKYIAQNGLLKPEQNVFERLRDKVARMYVDEVSGPPGMAYHKDASSFLDSDLVPAGTVDLIVTSPPYLRVVNYGQSNWIRLWLLGVDEVSKQGGKGRKQLDSVLDHKHSYRSYCDFIFRTLSSMARALKEDGIAVVIIGDVKESDQTAPLPLAKKVWEEIGERTGLRLLEIIEDDLPASSKVSRIWGETKGQATNRDCALILGRADGEPRSGFGEVTWDEPWKDGGPDAAHSRLRRVSG